MGESFHDARLADARLAKLQILPGIADDDPQPGAPLEMLAEPAKHHGGLAPFDMGTPVDHFSDSTGELTGLSDPEFPGVVPG